MTTDKTVTSKGKQDYITRMELVRKVERRFGVSFVLDLAASETNKRAPYCITEQEDALKVHWGDRMEKYRKEFDYEFGRHPTIAAWCNPPFGLTKDFAPRFDLYSKRGMKIITLTLASMDASWYLNYFRHSAFSLILEEREIFEGETEPFTKALMISLWGFGMTGLGWWNQEMP